MSEVWTVPDVFDHLSAALRARSGISSDVRIYTAHPGAYHPLQDAISLFGSEHDEEPAGLSGEDFDHFEIHGSVYVRRSGVDEAIAKATRDRVKTLYGEVAAEIAADRTIGGFLMRAQLRHGQFNQGTIPDDRWAEQRFQIECWASPT